MAKKILIVDDDQDIRRLLGVRLKSAGFETVFAGDAISAVRQWNPRKAKLMIEPHITAAWSQLERLGWLPEARQNVSI